MNTKIKELRVNSMVEANNIPYEDIILSWIAPIELTQYTVQMSPLPNYAFFTFFRDTHNHYYIYDGGKLKPNTTYYWRVRSGLGEWTGGVFTTR
jgi:hypothetical protein